MFNNSGGGIDLSPGNNSQAAPNLLSAVTSGGSLQIQGALQSIPNSTFRIELFADPSGLEQGQTFLGFVVVTTNGSGQASFNVTLTASVPVGTFVTATATDSLGDTSQFATDAQVGP